MRSHVESLRMTCLWCLVMLDVISAVQQIFVRKTMPSGNFQGGRRRRRRRTTVEIRFGGPKHDALNTGHLLLRPESIKQLVCGSTSCSECTQKSSCWHGVTRSAYIPGKTRISDTGTLQLKVPAFQDNIPNTRYVMELWAKCSSGNGKWTAQAKGLVNGDLKVYSNAKLVWRVSESESQGRCTKILPDFPQGDFSRCPKLEFPVGADTHLRVEFIRKTNSAASFGQFWIVARVDQYVEDCMAVKDCLASLGDGSEAAFKLRNDNKEQLKCLIATNDAARDAINSKCRPWVTCLKRDSGRIDKLKRLLEAGQESSAMLMAISDGSASKRDGAASKIRGPGECIDPAVDDAEAWSCDCMQDLVDACSGIDADCFRTKMCQSSEVCDEWKQSHCPTLFLIKANESTPEEEARAALVSMTRRGAIRANGTRSSMAMMAHGALDSSVTGKCTSESQ